MTWTSPDGGDRPQTWSARLLGAFSGPKPAAGAGGSKQEADARGDLAPRGAQSCHVLPRSARGQVVAGRLRVGDRRRYRHPRLHHRREQGHQRGKGHDRRRAGRQAPRRRHPAALCHRVLGAVEAQAHARGVRPVPGGLRLHPLHRADRVRVHPPRWLAHAPSLEAQQVRDHQRQGDRQGGRDAPRGRERKEAAKTGPKTTSGPAARKPPTASKRYTPKSPPRKKIPKPTE